MYKFSLLENVNKKYKPHELSLRYTIKSTVYCWLTTSHVKVLNGCAIKLKALLYRIGFDSR